MKKEIRIYLCAILPQYVSGQARYLTADLI